MRMTSFLVAVVAFLAQPVGGDALASEPGTTPSTSPTLSGTAWQWQQTRMNNDEEFTPDDPSNYTVHFMADGSVAIRADCNRARGTYTSDGSAIAITMGPSTMAACPEGSLGGRFATQLVGATIYFFRSDDLYLDLKFDSGTMKFAPQSSELIGRSWLVIGHNNGRGGVVSSIIGTEMTAAFGADGTVSGSAGCNQYRAGYEIAGNTISIGLATATRRFCAEPERTMEQEQEFLTALGTAATYRTTGDTMEMRTAKGSIVATFEAAKP
jgi:heat shock protein HslJ